MRAESSAPGRLAAGGFARLVAVLVLLGVPIGAWWWAVAPPVVATWTGAGFFPIQTEPDGYITADLQFGLWMLVFGIAASWWARRRWLASPVIALIALILGLLGAAALAVLVGGWLGPSATPDVLVGTRVEGPLRLRAPGLLLIGPIAAVAWWFAADLAASWREEADDEASDDEASGDEASGDEASGDEASGDGDSESDGGDETLSEPLTNARSELSPPTSA
jgi:hypothetical protein